MIRYEVTLNVEKDIETRFKKWLEPHVNQMLSFKGFIKASIHEEISENKNEIIVIVNYIVNCIDDLKYYFNINSNKMREDGLLNFPNQFTATRKVFNGNQEINL